MVGELHPENAQWNWLQVKRLVRLPASHQQEKVASPTLIVFKKKGNTDKTICSRLIMLFLVEYTLVMNSVKKGSSCSHKHTTTKLQSFVLWNHGLQHSLTDMLSVPCFSVLSLGCQCFPWTVANPSTQIYNKRKSKWISIIFPNLEFHKRHEQRLCQKQ